MGKNCNHNWVMNYVSPKVFARCINCSDRFPLDESVTGTPYRGPVPAKFKNAEGNS